MHRSKATAQFDYLVAVHTPYLAESFRTEIRSSGYGISYSLATIVPGFYSFYMLGFATLMQTLGGTS
jgi:hypothetical protein